MAPGDRRRRDRAAGGQPCNALTRALGLRYGPGGVTTATEAGARAFPDATFPSTVEPAFSATPDGSEVLVESPGGPAMVVIPLGQGAVWAASSPRWLTNAGSTARDCRSRCRWRGCGRHGDRGRVPPRRRAPRRDVRLPARWLQLALLEAAIIALAALLTVARRLGPAVGGRCGAPAEHGRAGPVDGRDVPRRRARLEAATAALGGQLRRRAGGLAGRVEGRCARSRRPRTSGRRWPRGTRRTRRRGG